MADEVFAGFRVPKEERWFKVPNEWTDITSVITSLAELKVIEYVMRHTWGYGEYDEYKHITVEEFVNGRMRRNGTRIDKGTGLSEFGVKDGLKRAIKHEYLVYTVDKRDRGRIKKFYALKRSDWEYNEDDDDETL